MLTFIWGVVLLLWIVLLALKFIWPEDISEKIKFKAITSSIITWFILLAFTGLFFYSEAWYSYLVQYPNWTQKPVLEPWYHLKFWWETIPFKKNLTVKASDWTNEEGKVETTWRIDPIEVRFNDNVTADVWVSVRFQLPSDPQKFKEIALEYRSQENLINATLIPTVAEVVRNSARMFSAQAYTTWRGWDFETVIPEQLRNWIYRLESIEKKVEGTESISTTEDRTFDSNELVKYEVKIKVDKDWNPVIREAVLPTLGIIVTQATIDSVDPEEAFKNQLSKQRDASAKANIERQEAEAAEYEKQKIIAQWEASKAQIKVDKEKEQVQILIAAETSQKEQKILLEKEKLALEAAKLQAQTKKNFSGCWSLSKRSCI